MKSEDVSIGIWSTVEGSDEVFEGVSSVVCKLCKQSLSLLFGERAHFVGCVMVLWFSS